MTDRRLNDGVVEWVWQGTLSKMDHVHMISPLWVGIYFDQECPERLHRALAKYGDIDRKRFLLFPVYVHSMKHWMLLAYDRHRQVMVTYDSLRPSLNTHRMHRKIFHMMKRYRMIDDRSELFVDEEYPQQHDGFSCGHRMITAMMLIAEQHRLLDSLSMLLYNDRVVKFIDDYDCQAIFVVCR